MGNPSNNRTQLSDYEGWSKSISGQYIWGVGASEGRDLNTTTGSFMILDNRFRTYSLSYGSGIGAGMEYNYTKFFR